MPDEKDDVKKEESTEEPSTTEETEIETEATAEETVEAVETEEDANKSNLQTRLDELTAQTQSQKALLEQLMMLGFNNQGNAQQQVLQEDAEDEPVTGKKVRALIQQKEQQFQGILSGVLDEMDKTGILASPRSSLYTKYQPEVEQFRQNMARQGRFFKREEALAAVLLSKGEIGKVAPKPKKVVKQQSKESGTTQNAAPAKKKTEQKSVTVRERLVGKTF